MLQPERQIHVWGGGSSPPSVSLVAVLPGILESVPVEDRQLAERALVVPRVLACDEDLAGPMSSVVPDAFDFLVKDGVVLKQTVLAGRAALELLGLFNDVRGRLAALCKLDVVDPSLLHRPGKYLAVERDVARAGHVQTLRDPAAARHPREGPLPVAILV
jgi:hypothetical protein